MKLHILSCHGSLDQNEARLFHDLGYEVTGEFDLGCTQRPQIPGVSDHNSPMPDDAIIILHQVPNYTNILKSWLDKGRKTILIGFGQSSPWQEKSIATLCTNYPNGWVVPYSVKDHRCYKEASCPDTKNHLIYFSEYLSDYQPWTGEKNQVFVACNEIHHRGAGCGWHLLQKIKDKLPLVMCGKRTEEIGGLGNMPLAEMLELYRTSKCFLSFGTQPAPLVMTQMQAWSAGTPTVCWDNGCGLNEEPRPMGMIVEKDLDVIMATIKRLMIDTEFANVQHANSLAFARRFDHVTVGQKWKELLEEVVK